jgi:DNA-binding transcriptional LysR family regulator
MGDLDLMLCERGHEPRQWPAIEIWRGRLRWITSDVHGRHREDPLPLSLSPGNCPFRPPWLDECIWRGAALRALEHAGRSYRIVSTSASITGQQTAVQAGLAVTVAIPHGLPEGLRATNDSEGLPELPEVSLLLLKAREPRQPVTDALFAHIIDNSTPSSTRMFLVSGNELSP